MAFNPLILGKLEMDSLNYLTGTGHNLQGVILYTVEPRGAGSSIDRAFGIVISGVGEPFDDSKYRPDVEACLSRLYANRPEIKALDFHTHSSALCASDCTLESKFSTRDEDQLKNNSLGGSYRILLSSPSRSTLFNVNNLAGRLDLSASPLEAALDSGAHSNEVIESVHQAYVPLLQGYGLDMYRMVRPSSQPVASQKKDLGFFMGNYFLCAGMLIGSKISNDLSWHMRGPPGDFLEWLAYGLAGVGACIGLYTFQKHVREGSR